MKNREFISFADFLAEKQLSESAKKTSKTDSLNEGVFDKVKDLVKNVIKKVKDFFVGKGCHFLNMLVYQQKKDLPRGVSFIPNEADLEALSLLDSKVTKSSIPVIKAIKESFDFFETTKILSSMKNETLNEGSMEYEKAININKEELLEEIKISIDTEKPIMIWGAPGIGKTQIVDQANKSFYSGRMIAVELAVLLPENFMLPAAKSKDFSNPANRVSIELPAEWLPVYHKSEGQAGDDRINGIDGKGGVLFLDELSRAKPGLTNALLGIIESRAMGDYVLGSKWRVICAGNREQDDTNANLNIESPARDNRMHHVNYVPTVDNWADWALSQVKKKEDGSEELELLIDPTIPMFLRFSEKFFHLLDMDNYSHAWPSPRSWAAAGKKLVYLKKAAAAQGIRLTRRKIEIGIAGVVGQEAASSFLDFLRLIEEIDPEELKKVWTDGAKAPVPKDPKADILYAYISGAIFNKEGKKLSVTDLQNYFKWVIRLGKTVKTGTGAKWVQLAHKTLISTHPEIKATEELYKAFALGQNSVVDEFPDFFGEEEYKKIMELAKKAKEEEARKK